MQQKGSLTEISLMEVLAVFVFVAWFWLLITVASDLFRRHDISGWIKAIWVIVFIVAPYIGVLAYLIFQGRGITERNAQLGASKRAKSFGAWLDIVPQMKSKNLTG